MKKIITIGFFIISAIASAQKNTIINANITGLKPGQWVYCRTFDDSKKDSVKSVQNGFHLKLDIPEGEGNIYLLQIGKGYKDNNTTMVYLDKGIISIKGKGPMFKDVKLSGTASLRDWNAYNDFVKRDTRLKDADTLYKQANALYEKHDSTGLTALQPQLNLIDSVRSELAKQWVNEHAGSSISAFIISWELRYKLSMDELEKAINQLSPAAKNNIPAKEILQSIKIDKLTGIGRTALDFTQNDTSGKPVSLKDFRGKYVLVDFWASWCKPCREENPKVVEAFHKYKDKNFTVLSVSLDQPTGKEKWLKAIHEDSLTWTHVSDLKYWNNEVAKQYDIRSIPSNLLIDTEGKIVGKNLRGEELDKKLDEVLK